MEPVFDELTLVSCGGIAIGDRIRELARTMSSLDQLGVPRVVRSVSQVATTAVFNGSGLSKWCFDVTVDRDAGRLVAGRLSSQPYIDGPEGLLEGLEEGRAIETKVNGDMAVGLGYCYFTEGFPIGLTGASFNGVTDRELSVYCMEETGEWTESVKLRLLLSKADVQSNGADITAKLDSQITDGQDILRRAGEVFPHLLFGATAAKQLEKLTGSELHYSHVVRHLRALQNAATAWHIGSKFEPSVAWSVESRATLDHGKFGPMREFPWPDGHEGEQWSKHTKIGPNAYRIYFESVPSESRIDVCIGYVGPHLPTVKHEV